MLRTELFTVERRSITSPDGRMLERDCVVHPGAVVVLPILDDGSIVMIRNHRYTIQRELFELPAGTIESDEAPIDTARREQEEETGYRADRIDPMMTFYTSPGILTEQMHAFIARNLSHVGQILQGGERITPHIMASDRVRTMLLNGTLNDGKTIAVLGRYLLEQNA